MRDDTVLGIRSFLQELVMAEARDGALISEELLRNLLVGMVFASHETTIG